MRAHCGRSPPCAASPTRARICERALSVVRDLRTTRETCTHSGLERDNSSLASAFAPRCGAPPRQRVRAPTRDRRATTSAPRGTPPPRRRRASAPRRAAWFVNRASAEGRIDVDATNRAAPTRASSSSIVMSGRPRRGSPPRARALGPRVPSRAPSRRRGPSEGRRRAPRRRRSRALACVRALALATSSGQLQPVPKSAIRIRDITRARRVCMSGTRVAVRGARAYRRAVRADAHARAVAEDARPQAAWRFDQQHHWLRDAALV